MSRYHPALVVLHWLLALMLFVALAMGTLALDPMPNDDPAKIDALRSHMITGVAILVLTLIRLVVRLCTTHPPKADIGNPLLNRLASWAHWGLYLAVFAMAGSGIAMSVVAGLAPIVFGASADPLPASFEDLAPRAAHGFFAAVLMLLIAAHIAAAFYHELVRHDGLIARMWFGRRT